MSDRRVVLVTQHPGSQRATVDSLAGQGLQAEVAPSEEAALNALRALETPVVLVGPDVTGSKCARLAERVRAAVPGCPVVVVANEPELADVVAAYEAGVFSLLPQPVAPEALARALEAALRADDPTPRPAGPPPERAGRDHAPRLVGRSAAMSEVFSEIAAAAGSSVPVFLVGETGTGKELVARTIHERACRVQGREGRFVPVDLGAQDPNLVASRLFGHGKGAFTDAVSERRGALNLAEDGTLFLDEVANASPDLQATLLRVLQEREFVPLGAEEPETTNARFVAATNRDPRRLMDRGELRADLFHRLAGQLIQLPPLRERMEDLDVLVEHLLKRIVAEEHGDSLPTLSEEAWERLHRHSWPGNVRELEHCLRAAWARSRGGTILGRHIQFVSAGSQPQVSAPSSSGGARVAAAGHRGNVGPDSRCWIGPDGRFLTYEKGKAAHIEAALRRTGGNVSRAAEILDVARSTLHRWMQQLDLSRPE